MTTATIVRPAALGIVHAFARVARPVMTMHMRPNNCVAATRITIDVLKAFNLTATPMVVEAQLYSPALMALHDRLGRWPTRDEAAADPGVYMVGVGCVQADEEIEEDGWRAHMVARVDVGGPVPFMLDASLEQGNRPAYDIQVPPVTVGPLFALPMWGRARNGTAIVYTDHPNPPPYEHAPDWRDPQRFAWEVAVITDLTAQQLIKEAAP